VVAEGRARARQAGAGRGGLLVLAAVAALAAALAVAWRALAMAPPPRVAVSQQSAISADSKVRSMDDARGRATRTSRLVPVTQTFSDAEISSLANERARTRHLPFRDVVLHATRGGAVRGQAVAHVAGQDVPVTLEVVPTVTEDNHLVLRVTRIQVGGLPVPAPVAAEVQRSVQEAIDTGIVPADLADVRVQVGEGRVTVSGVARPS
jgi:uncharacterized protein YpmS